VPPDETYDLNDLGDEARAVIAGMLHIPTDEHAGIFAPDGAWDEAQKAFPRDLFDRAVKDGVVDFDKEAGT
jgi:hypothetical protein